MRCSPLRERLGAGVDGVVAQREIVAMRNRRAQHELGLRLGREIDGALAGREDRQLAVADPLRRLDPRLCRRRSRARRGRPAARSASVRRARGEPRGEFDLRRQTRSHCSRPRRSRAGCGPVRDRHVVGALIEADRRPELEMGRQRDPELEASRARHRHGRHIKPSCQTPPPARIHSSTPPAGQQAPLAGGVLVVDVAAEPGRSASRCPSGDGYRSHGISHRGDVEVIEEDERLNQLTPNHPGLTSRVIRPSVWPEVRWMMRRGAGVLDERVH